MGLRILWQDLFPTTHPYYPDLHLIHEAIARAARKSVRADTEVTMSHVDKYCAAGSPCLDVMNGPQMMQQVIRAEEQGFDAAVMGCFYDPAVRETRSAVTIPVAGAAESAMLMAQLLGNKFAVVADWQTDVPILEEKIRAYGFEDRAMRHRPVRSAGRNDDTFEIIIDCLKRNDPSRLIGAFEEVAKDCIADGADTVIMGCAYTGAIFDLWDYREVAGTGVPVVSAAMSSLKMAEMLGDAHKRLGLKRSTSVNSLYVTARREDLKQAADTFGV
jgi:allantoin racemase